MKNSERFVTSWTVVSIVAQSASAATAFVAAAVSWAGILPVILLEACLLGIGQRWILRRALPGLERGWLGATVCGMLLGRYAQFGADASPAATSIANLPTGIQIALGAVLGFLVGALMAAPQAYLLVGRVSRAWRWIAVRGVAWSVALPSLMIAGVWLGQASASGLAVLVAAIFGTFALVGTFVGLVEGIGLASLIRVAAGWQDRSRTASGDEGHLTGSLARTTAGGHPK
jgi:hypothetical protein